MHPPPADPFLDAQDFCAAYQVGAARYEGNKILVDVRGNCPGRTDTLPDVLAELNQLDSTWVFVNFLYPRRGSDLLRDLAELRRAREAKP